MCKIESCPNVVVESLSCGIPIVCNNIGGTPELVGLDGIIIDVDKEFKFNFISEQDVDNINTDVLAKGIDKCVNTTWDIHRHDLDIQNVANDYFNIFQKAVSSWQ